MTAEEALPGSPRHQAVLRAVVDHYAGDPRVRAVAMFGSLGRGTWDRYSDLDLDVVIGDEVRLDAVREAGEMCRSLASAGERAALIVPSGPDAADIVLASLIELSIRYHPLATTSPNIVDSLRLLAGPLDAAAIVAAGLACPRPAETPLAQLLDACLRHAVGVDVSLQRRRIWGAIGSLQRMREAAMELFARSHGGVRPYHGIVFQAEADAALQAALGATLPQYSLRSARAALARFLDLLERDLAALTADRLRLTEAQRAVIARVRARQKRLGEEER